jgi:fructokinase
MNTTEHLQLDQLPSEFKEENRIFVFGSVATTLSLSGATLKEFARLQLQKECIVLFDPNTRPSVIPDLDKYRTGLEDWVRTASVVKASEEDISFTYPDMTCEDVAAHWLSLSVTAAFITRGDKGCSVFSKDGNVYVPAQNNPAITRTVGAGDNFNAGIAIALAKRNVTTREKLSALTMKDWESVTAEANDTSYQHLLRLNNVLKAA